MNAMTGETPKVSRRTAARLAAVQALYQIDMTGAPTAGVVREFLGHRLERDGEGNRLVAPDRRLFEAIVTEVMENRDDLDRGIESVLTPDWPLDRVDRVLRAILRAGAYELRDREDIPPAVVISEYVDVAKAFYSRKEPGLVNGVLDRLSRIFRARGPAAGT